MKRVDICGVVVSTEAEVVCDTEDTTYGLRVVWEFAVKQADPGPNERFDIVEEVRKDGRISLRFELCQFYSGNSLIDLCQSLDKK